MTDPRFPNRPNHPDFWLMSQAIVDTDAQSETGQAAPDIMGRLVDVESLTYVAEQRALRAAPRLETGGLVFRNPQNMSILAGLWIDAFVAGARFQHLKTTNAQSAEDTPPEE
jgi:hypothetical protein